HELGGRTAPVTAVGQRRYHFQYRGERALHGISSRSAPGGGNYRSDRPGCRILSLPTSRTTTATDHEPALNRAFPKLLLVSDRRPARRALNVTRRPALAVLLPLIATTGAVAFGAAAHAAGTTLTSIASDDAISSS